jgi:excisionase family DNA binding protein
MFAKTYVSVVELASQLGLPKAWLRHEAQAGRIPALRIGRRQMFNPESVQHALVARMESADGGEQEGRR